MSCQERVALMNKQGLDGQSKGYSTKRSSAKSRKADKRKKLPSKGTVEVENGLVPRSESGNDVQWYFKDPVLANIAGQVNFSWPAGVPVVLNSNRNTAIPYSAFPTQLVDIKIPGLMTLRLIDVMPSKDAASAINVASRGIYTFVRSKNSGARNYEQMDLMVYLLANASIYGYINFLQRLLKAASSYNQLNFFLPDQFYIAQGVSPQSIRENLADFKFGIQQLILKASRNCVPNQQVLPLLARKAFMYSEVYREGTSPKDQLYMFIPFGFYQFVNTSTGGSLAVSNRLASSNKRIFQPGANTTVQELLQFGEQLLAAIMMEEDFANMSGDVAKAYEGKLITLDPVQVDAVLVPKFDIAVLEQIKNATIIPNVGGGFGITQVSTSDANGYLSCEPIVYSSSSVNNTTPTKTDLAFENAFTSNGWDKMLTTTTEYTDPGLVMESSRLITLLDMQSAKLMGSSTWKYQYNVICGTEIAQECAYWLSNYQYRVGQDPGYLSVPSVTLIDDTAVSADTGPILASYKSHFISNFRFHPLTRLFHKPAAESENVLYYGDEFDFDNYAVITPVVLQRLHDTAVMSMLNVPSTSTNFMAQG